MSEFEVGDVVKIKCNPQEMVVHYVGTWDDLRSGTEEKKPVLDCVWIDDYGQPHSEKYVPEVLEKTDVDPREEEETPKKTGDFEFDSNEPKLQGG